MALLPSTTPYVFPSLYNFLQAAFLPSSLYNSLWLSFSTPLTVPLLPCSSQLPMTHLIIRLPMVFTFSVHVCPPFCIHSLLIIFLNSIWFPLRYAYPYGHVCLTVHFILFYLFCLYCQRLPSHSTLRAYEDYEQTWIIERVVRNTLV